jgi:hypothetical protein
MIVDGTKRTNSHRQAYGMDLSRCSRTPAPDITREEYWALGHARPHGNGLAPAGTGPLDSLGSVL